MDNYSSDSGKGEKYFRDSGPAVLFSLLHFFKRKKVPSLVNFTSTSTVMFTLTLILTFYVNFTLILILLCSYLYFHSYCTLFYFTIIFILNVILCLLPFLLSYSPLSLLSILTSFDLYSDFDCTFTFTSISIPCSFLFYFIFTSIIIIILYF